MKGLLAPERLLDGMSVLNGIEGVTSCSTTSEVEYVVTGNFLMFKKFLRTPKKGLSLRGTMSCFVYEF